MDNAHTNEGKTMTWETKKAQLVRTHTDGTMDIRCCRPNCNGLRTHAPAAWRWASVPCNDCIKQCRRAPVEPVSEGALVRAERQQSGISALD